MIETGDILGLATSSTTKLMSYWAMYERVFPHHLRVHIEKHAKKHAKKLMGSVSNSVQIKFNEYNRESYRRSEAYSSIRNYLATKSIAGANRLKANETGSLNSLVFSMDDDEVLEDEFKGVKVEWSSTLTRIESKRGYVSEDKRFFTLSFNRKQREIIVKDYLSNVLRKGKEIELKNRERKLYTNSEYGYWESVPFNHPATFQTLAMNPEMTERIKKDLTRFRKSKEYYNKVGKPWKRGYLLFGPPGTGKSTMISAMANFLNYDVYDLELTSVNENKDLKSLLLDTKEKSIIVIEDIDCSLALVGEKRKKKEEEEEEEEEEEKEKTSEDKSKVTLSGLLNAIDGLWSSCTDEKFFVFTTNFVGNLDPALIRRGRMDNHIEMSYCRFEAFKVLAKNYLDIESHDLYGEIKSLIEVTDMSPADVAENLMPKSDGEDADTCLLRLAIALEEKKKKGGQKDGV